MNFILMFGSWSGFSQLHWPNPVTPGDLTMALIMPELSLQVLKFFNKLILIKEN